MTSATSESKRVGAGGRPLPLWSNPLPGTVLQAAPAGMFTSLGGAFDYVLIGTRNASGGNFFYALRADDGTVWGAPFDNPAIGGDGTGEIGIISGGAAVDYPGQKVYFASRRRGGGSPNALWCLNLTAAGLTFAWALDLADDVDGSPVLRGGRVYVGTNSGRVIGVDAADRRESMDLRHRRRTGQGFRLPRPLGHQPLRLHDQQGLGPHGRGRDSQLAAGFDHQPVHRAVQEEHHVHLRGKR